MDGRSVERLELNGYISKIWSIEISIVSLYTNEISIVSLYTESFSVSSQLNIKNE